MAARELWFGWLGRLSNLLNTAADLTSDSVSGRSSLYTEVDRWWWVGNGSHEHRITFIEIEVVGEGGEPFLHNQHSVAPILYLQRCFYACVVFHGFFRNCLQEWSVYMCQILYLIAEACPTEHILLEINTWHYGHKLQPQNQAPLVSSCAPRLLTGDAIKMHRCFIFCACFFFLLNSIFLTIGKWKRKCL